jgi:hypothetical protein
MLRISTRLPDSLYSRLFPCISVFKNTTKRPKLSFEANPTRNCAREHFHRSCIMFMQLWFRQNKSWLNERLWRINLFCVVRLNFNVKIRDRARLRLNKNAAAGSFMFLLGTGTVPVVMRWWNAKNTRMYYRYLFLRSNVARSPNVCHICLKMLLVGGRRTDVWPPGTWRSTSACPGTSPGRDRWSTAELDSLDH